MIGNWDGLHEVVRGDFFRQLRLLSDLVERYFPDKRGWIWKI